MSKLPEVTHQDGTIYVGAAFLWEVTLYDDPEKTVLTELTGMTPQAVLTDSKGNHVADFLCTYLAASSTKPKRIAMFLPTAISATVTPGKSYPYNMVLIDSNAESYRKLMGVLEAAR